MKKILRILKKIFTILSVLSFAALFIVVLTSAIEKQSQLECKNLMVKIDYDSGLAFLNETEIKERINFLSGENIIGKKLSTIDYKTLEKELDKNPFVEDAQISVDQKQNILVDVKQKRPILRILNNDGVSYYISEKNEHIPLNSNFTSHVAVAIGNVQTHSNAKRDSAVQTALYNLIQLVRKDEFLNSFVDQIYVYENGEMEVLTKVSGQTIRIGAATGNTNEKFERLKTFYKEGLSKTGWEKYKAIDLRYNNQVVCEKRDTTKI
jgi:cell division protein FtsQ